MDLELSGRTAAVIGGWSGIGAAVGELLAQEGGDVAVTYRDNPDGAAEAARAVRGQGRRAGVGQLDLAHLQAGPAGARALATEPGGLDVAVLSAGRNIVTPIDTISPEEWTQVLDVNLGGAFF